MTNLDRERISSEPLELYLFSVGDTTHYAYNNGERAVVNPGDGRTYTPLTVDRGRVSSAASLDKTQMKVVVPLDSAIATAFKIYPPGFKVTLKIYSGDAKSPAAGFSAVWVGRVIQCSRETVSGGIEQAVLTCEPASTTMRQSGLRRAWTLSCAHVLYGTVCGASEAAATVSVATSAVAATAVTLPDGWEGATDPTKFKHGKVSWHGEHGTEQRMILGVSGDVLTLAGPTQGLVVGDSVDVSWGCNRLRSDCLDLHNNIVNYGGQPWIPVENPVNKSQVSNTGTVVNSGQGW